jgi:hypothetical protein
VAVADPLLVVSSHLDRRQLQELAMVNGARDMPVRQQ